MRGRRRGVPSRGVGSLVYPSRHPEGVGPGALGSGALTPKARPLTDESGSASVLAALWIVVLTMLAAAAIALTSVLGAREAVSAAADLAALAGASATLEHPDRACSRAAGIARENGARMTECRVAGTGVWVVAQVPAPRPVQWLVPGRGNPLSARAHAELTAVDQ